MNALFSRFQEPVYAALRIVSGFLFACHGWGKIFGGVGHGPFSFSDKPQMFSAGIIELVGGAMILIGLGTRPAAFLCSGTMAVAYFQAHQPQGVLPIENGGELAVVYCFVFLFMAAKGDGVASVRAMLGGSSEGSESS